VKGPYVDEDSADPITTRSPATDALAFIGGYVCAEGCFTRAAPMRDFRFTIGVGAEDEPLLHWIRSILGVGRVNRYPRRQPHYDDEAVFAVAARRDLVEVIVPFMDEWLPESYKREQYLAWRADLLGVAH